ncbi:DUF1801 domain-containing protein [Chiayiivirga flava]|uniref:YdhG-like domain-containing protein n=1 Tax=Chiayiivirga flava TaxID=659595 RepID=A0A7W8FZF2_9GAMM|nr:DUF1801 domain-containing protein [Chiayiivirga flava]MBB5208071.1 hypothetical protein [Chiayiivirga flava]
MAELKTQKTLASPAAFLATVTDERRRRDAQAVCTLMQEVTGDPPAMWGPAIVGFGHCRLRYESGRELDWMLVGFSPRKAALTLYIMPGFDAYDGLLARLGRFTTGKSCLYVKRLDEVDMDVLRELVARSVRHMRERNGVAD